MVKSVLIAGGTGLIGRAVADSLHEAGYAVRLLSRREDPSSPYPVFHWDEVKADSNAFRDLYAAINLAGAGIADKPWTAARKQEIIRSRVDSHRLLIAKMREISLPKVYVSAGAIGFYGHRGEEWLDETSPAGNGFLSRSCQIWEEAVHESFPREVRPVIFRIGVVLSTQGGALGKMMGPWRCGVSTILGSGDQWYSWIHVRDLARLFQFALEKETMKGIFNATSPRPERMATLAEELHARNPSMWKWKIPVPGIGLSAILGEMASVVTDSSRVSSKKIQDLGFKFQYPDLTAALDNLIGSGR